MGRHDTLTVAFASSILATSVPGKIAQENWALQSVLNGKRRGAIM